LIDFFAAIESEQTSIFPSPQQQQQQQPFSPQSPVYVNPAFAPTYASPTTNQFTPTTNQQFFPSQQPFAPQQFASPQHPIRPEWTGAGFGGYTPSSATSPVHVMPTIPSATPQPQFSQPVQNTSLQPDHNSVGTNPFRASTMPQASSPQTFSPDHGTNPFSAGQRVQTMSPTLNNAQPFSNQASFASVPQQQSTFQQPFQNQAPTTFQQPQQSTFQPTSSQQSVFQQSTQSQPAFIPAAPVQVSTSTGTNPFSRPQQLQTQTRLTPQVTGSNPFRQSAIPGGTTSQTQATLTNGFGWSPK
jgi:phosphatidylinositol-binding clathrin assembly protein